MWIAKRTAENAKRAGAEDGSQVPKMSYIA
jgi:hypothetical protein